VQHKSHPRLLRHEFFITPREPYVDKDVPCFQSGNLVILLMFSLGSLKNEETFSHKMVYLGSLLPARHDAPTLKKDGHISWILKGHLEHPADLLFILLGTGLPSNEDQ